MSEKQTIRAIPTVYAGTTFRSRNEARRAVFFDELDIEWEYEIEGWELRQPTWKKRTIRYVPDFWLPYEEMYVEVKRDETTMSDDEVCRAQERCSLLAEASEHPVILCCGPPHAYRGGAVATYLVTRGCCRLKQANGCGVCGLAAEACDTMYSTHYAAFLPGRVAVVGRGEDIPIGSNGDCAAVNDAIQSALAYDFSAVPFPQDLKWRTA